ncbi:EF hand protein [Acetobacteraceae bacterium AT-5844]|nr:EF hand protein [Acetobacteraceae bacterium AT-5844]
MRIRPILAACLLLPVLAAAQPPAPGRGGEAALPTLPQAFPAVPEALRGPWYQGECAAPDATLQLTARAAARLPSEGPARLIRFVETRPVEGWTMGVGRGAEAPRILLRGTATALDTVEPDAKLRDDRLPGPAPVQSWHRCPTAPASVTTLHGEGVAFLAALESLESACGSNTPDACIATVLREADVSGDGKLSVAEIARLVRGATWLLAAADEATPEAVLATAGGGMLGGVALARLMMESLDYDGDGKLSANELAQDRVGFGRATGNPAGRPLRMEGLQEGVALLRGVMEGLLLDH